MKTNTTARSLVSKFLALGLVLSATPMAALAGNHPDYRWDEARNPGGANRCQTDRQCDGARTCSQWGWCQGEARPQRAAPAEWPRQRASFFVKSKLAGQVLDVQGGNRSPGAAVIAYPQKQGAENQVWEVVPSSIPGFFFIRSQMNGYVLDIKGGDRREGAAVIAYPQKPNGADNQLWELVPSRDPSYVFIRSRMNGFVLDIRGGRQDAGAPIIAYPQKRHGADNQLWELVPSNPRMPRPPRDHRF
jgi:hypothetical protein